MNEAFSLSELNDAIDLAKDTTPGRDGITYSMLKHVGVVGKNCLLHVINRSWSEGSCPLAWKEAVLSPILKQGKDASDPLSYRPIALTPVLCKIMERMINNRLNWFLEKHALFSQHQSGFRKGRRTVDHLIRLENDINKGICNKECTLAIFLDIEKAYDMVWKKGIIINLAKLGVGSRYINWINSWLKNRKIQVKVNGHMSVLVNIDNGVPQGSVLSPTLFSIMVNSMNKCILPLGVDFSQYADDVAIWKSHRNIPFLIKKIQLALDALKNWCDMWGFKISFQKTVCVLFGNKRNVEVNLKLDNNVIQQKTQYKFLGMIFDKRLTWKSHVDGIIDRCKHKLNLLRCISGCDWGSDSPTLVRLYKAIIRPVLEYGCEAFDSASKSVKSGLDSVQYQALKIATGAIRGTSLRDLQVECGDPPLHLRRKYLTRCFKANLDSYRNPHPAKDSIRDCWQFHYANRGNVLTSHVPFGMRVCDDVFDVLPNCPYVFPFWKFENIKVEWEIYYAVRNLNSEVEKKCLADEIIGKQYSNHLHIYTDGSKYDKGTESRVGCAIYIPHLSLHYKFRLSNNLTVFSSELVAILKALQWVEEARPMQACIFSDCRSALQTLSQFRPSNCIVNEIVHVFSSLKWNGIPVCFVWVPSHCGIHGNEGADVVAKKATRHTEINIPVKMSLAEVKSVIKNDMIVEWQEEWATYPKRSILSEVKPKVNLHHNVVGLGRRDEITIHRLRLGKCSLNFYLFIMGKHNDGLCDSCGVHETIKHILITCCKYSSQRKILFDKVDKSDNTSITLVDLLGGTVVPFKEVCLFISECKIQI